MKKAALAAGLTLAACTLTGTATAAAAETFDAPQIPAPYMSHPITPDDDQVRVVSPYGKSGECSVYRGEIVRCFQQRPDGRWVELNAIAGLRVYPAWDDPQALLNLVPAELREQVAQLSSGSSE